MDKETWAAGLCHGSRGLVGCRSYEPSSGSWIRTWSSSRIAAQGRPKVGRGCPTWICCCSDSPNRTLKLSPRCCRGRRVAFFGRHGVGACRCCARRDGEAGASLPGWRGTARDLVCQRTWRRFQCCRSRLSFSACHPPRLQGREKCGHAL